MEEWMLIKQGAESKIYLTKYLDKDTLVKERFPKLYRIKHLDDMISKHRMRAEVKALAKAHIAGIKVPIVYHIDIHAKCIYMENIKEALTLKKLLNDMEAIQQFSVTNVLGVALGNIIAKLHLNGIIHGDLTTSNFLYQCCIDDINQMANVELHAIDFGLSHSFSIAPQDSNSVLEDKAVDLYVMERAFVSTHPSLKHLLNDVILRAYFDEIDRASQNTICSKRILNKLEEVRMRGRKRTMIG